MTKIKKHDSFHKESLKKKFEKLKEQWKEEIFVVSDPNILYNNRYYKEIINLGEDVVPILLGDLGKNFGDWFSALKQITNEDPIKNEHNGNVTNMINDWIEWSKSKNIDIYV